MLENFNNYGAKVGTFPFTLIVAVGLIVNSSPVYTSETPEELVASRVETHDCLQAEALSLEKCKGEEEDQQAEAVRAIPAKYTLMNLKELAELANNNDTHA